MPAATQLERCLIHRGERRGASDRVCNPFTDTSREKLFHHRERGFAVVNKFYGYIEGAEVTIASDHQPFEMVDDTQNTDWTTCSRERNYRVESKVRNQIYIDGKRREDPGYNRGDLV